MSKPLSELAREMGMPEEMINQLREDETPTEPVEQTPWLDYLASVAFGASADGHKSQWHAVAAAVEAEVVKAQVAYCLERFNRAVVERNERAGHEWNGLILFLEAASWRKVPDHE